MTHELQLIQHKSPLSRIAGALPNGKLVSWRLGTLVLGAGISALALWAVFQNSGTAAPTPDVDGVAAQSVPAAQPADEFAGLFVPREPIPVAPSRTIPVSAAPDEPGSEVVASIDEDLGAVDVTIAPVNPSEPSGGPLAGILHPTPSWVNAFSPDSSINGRPLAVGDIVTAYDQDGVLLGRSVVEAEGKYGVMALYMDDPSTPVDEGADPGEEIIFKVNGVPARVVGPHLPVWSSNGDILMLNLAAGE